MVNSQSWDVIDDPLPLAGKTHTPRQLAPAFLKRAEHHVIVPSWRNFKPARHITLLNDLEIVESSASYNPWIVTDNGINGSI